MCVRIRWFPLPCGGLTVRRLRSTQEAVRTLYQKHVSVTIAEQGLDVDIQREYARQREYLERSVSSLKTKLVKETDRHKKDSVRIMQENVALIRYACCGGTVVAVGGAWRVPHRLILIRGRLAAVSVGR